MPGHKQLHERVIAALGRCQEPQDIDFKESAPWESLRWKLVKTSLVMGNLRDGGIIVIGAAERNDTWDLNGIAAADLSTYDVDVILDVINSYVSPHVAIDIVTVKHPNGKVFLAIQVHEYDDSPLVCKKNGPEDLLEGSVYVRPSGMARTTRITKAQQMRELLELAAEKRARRILEVSRRVGLSLEPVNTENRFDEELQGL